MTCYMRHLTELFDQLGLAYDKPSRDAVDAAIREAYGIPDEAHCPAVWATVKAISTGDLAEKIRPLITP